MDIDKRDDLERGAWNRLVAMGFLVNSDKEKYGRLLKDLRKDFANEYDNFPRTLMMMRERMDYTYKETSNKSGSKDKEKDGDKEKSKTTEDVEFATSFAQIAHGKKTCFI